MIHTRTCAVLLMLAPLLAITSEAAAQRTGPLNFTEPDPLDVNDHQGYVSIFDGR